MASYAVGCQVGVRCAEVGKLRVSKAKQDNGFLSDSKYTLESHFSSE